MGSSPIIKNPGKGEYALLGAIGILFAAGYFFKDEVKDKVEEKVDEKKRKHKKRSRRDSRDGHDDLDAIVSSAKLHALLFEYLPDRVARCRIILAGKLLTPQASQHDAVYKMSLIYAQVHVAEVSKFVDAMEEDYVKSNKANWDERAPEHAKSSQYCFQRMQEEATYISDVVRFDIPLLGSIEGLDVVHLQCHIATDTLSLARRGAKSVVGLDFSPASLEQARHLAKYAADGDKLSFVEVSTYEEALSVLPAESFDMVFTGIGALCWLPSIKR